MNKQPLATITKHLVRAVVPLFLVLIAMSFAQGQRQNSGRSISNSKLLRDGELRSAGARRSQNHLEYDRTYRFDGNGNRARVVGFAASKGRNERQTRIAGGGA